MPIRDSSNVSPKLAENESMLFTDINLLGPSSMPPSQPSYFITNTTFKKTSRDICVKLLPHFAKSVCLNMWKVCTKHDQKLIPKTYICTNKMLGKKQRTPTPEALLLWRMKRTVMQNTDLQGMHNIYIFYPMIRWCERQIQLWEWTQYSFKPNSMTTGL